MELGRKLTLAGLIGVVGRGTVAQACVATLIAFWFFAISFKERPFKKSSLNQIKSFSEFQLFAVLLVCTVLQSNSAVKGFSDELVTVEEYGEALKYLTILIIPVTLYLFIVNYRGDSEEEEGGKKLTWKQKKKQKIEKKKAKKKAELDKKQAKKDAKAEKKSKKKNGPPAQIIKNPMMSGMRGNEIANPLAMGSDSDEDESENIGVASPKAGALADDMEIEQVVKHDD